MLCARATPRPPASPTALGPPAHHVEKHLFQRRLAVGVDQTRRRAVLDDAARIEQDDAIGEPLNLSHVVRGEQQRRAAALRVVLELPPDPVGGVGVERGGRLIEQEKLRRVEQRLGEADAGLLAGRQFAGRAVEQILDLQIPGDIGDALGGVADAVKPGIDGQVLFDREPRRQIDIRALEIQPMRDRAAIAAHIGAEHPHLARARHHKAEQHGDGRGLARPVAAKQSHRRGLSEAEADMVDGGDGAVDLGEVAHCHGHARLGARLCDAFARRLACTIYSLIHSFAKAFRFVGIMALSPMLDFTYGRPRQ